MSEERNDLGFLTNPRTRKALSEAGYDTLDSVLAAGEDEIVGGVKYVSASAWQEIEAEAKERGLAAPVKSLQPPPDAGFHQQNDRLGKVEEDLRTIIDFLRGHPVELP